MKKRRILHKKVEFREKWNSAFSKLSENERNNYSVIINTTLSMLGSPQVKKSTLYNVKRGKNNACESALEALEAYVSKT